MSAPGEDVAFEEGQLVSDDRFVLGTVVDVEVDAGIEPQLALRRAPGGGDRDARTGDLVGAADADQPRAVQVLGMATGVEGAAEQPARRGAVAPARLLAARDDSPPPRLAVRGVDERRLVRLPDGGQVLAAIVACRRRRS